MVIGKDNIFTKYKINPSLSQNEIIATFQKTPELRKILPNIYSKLKDSSYLALSSLETVFYEELDKNSDKNINTIKIENDFGFNFNWIKKNFSAYKNSELKGKDLTLFLLGTIIFYLTALKNTENEDNLKLIETVIELFEKLSAREIKNINKLTKSLTESQIITIKEQLLSDIMDEINQIVKDVINNYDPKKINLLFKILSQKQKGSFENFGKLFYEELSASIEKSNDKVEDEMTEKIINLLKNLDSEIIDNSIILKSIKYFFSKMRDNMQDDYLAYVNSLETAEKVLSESDFVTHLTSFIDLGNYVVLNLLKKNVISKQNLNKISTAYKKYSQSIINNDKFSIILSKEKIEKDIFIRVSDTFIFFSSLKTVDYNSIQDYYDLVIKKVDLKVNLYELIRLLVINNANENVKLLMNNILSKESGFLDKMSLIFEYKAKQLIAWLDEYNEKNIDTYATILHFINKESSIVSYGDYYDAINSYYSLTALNSSLVETFDGIIGFVVSPVFYFIRKLNSNNSIMSTYSLQQNIKSAFSIYFSKFSPNDYFSIKDKKTLSQRFAEANVSEIITLSGNSQTRSYIEKCNKIKNDIRDNNEEETNTAKTKSSPRMSATPKTTTKKAVANIEEDYDSDFGDTGSFAAGQGQTTSTTSADAGTVLVILAAIVGLVIFFVAPQIFFPILFFVWLFYKLSKS